jgi:hypothetical protein
MNEHVNRSRRSLLWAGPVAGLALTIPSALIGQKSKEEDEEEVTPAEDLMREHGLLKRILLIYDEVESRIAQQKEFPRCSYEFGQDHSFVYRKIPREARE